ncbi:MAG: hypothetical protein ACLRZH_12050 [Ruthenibacterium lactatiformans]
MGKKQKKMLARILVSAVLFAAGFFLPLAGWSAVLSYGLRNHRVTSCGKSYGISLTGRYLTKIFDGIGQLLALFVCRNFPKR